MWRIRFSTPKGPLKYGTIGVPVKIKSFLASSLIALAATSATGQLSTSESYSLLSAQPAQSGGAVQSTGGTVTAQFSVGAPIGGGVSPLTAGGIQTSRNFAGQLYEVRSLAFSANPNPVTEGDTTQLSPGVATLDDNTTLILTPSEIAWRVVSGPIVSISESGLATAGVAEADTPATLEGAVLNFAAQFVVTVRNSVELTEFEQWQIDHFGSTTAREAQGGANPDGDPHDNDFEFVAGLIPTDPNSRLRFRVDLVTGQPQHREIVFSPRLPDRTYRVLRSENLTPVSFSLLSAGRPVDDGDQRTVIDRNAPPLDRFYQIEITK